VLLFYDRDRGRTVAAGSDKPYHDEVDSDLVDNLRSVLDMERSTTLQLRDSLQQQQAQLTERLQHEQEQRAQLTEQLQQEQEHGAQLTNSLHRGQEHIAQLAEGLQQEQQRRAQLTSELSRISDELILERSLTSQLRDVASVSLVRIKILHVMYIQYVMQWFGHVYRYGYDMIWQDWY